MRRILMAVTVVLLLAASWGAAQAATAPDPGIAQPDVICGNCDGSGYNGCATVRDGVADGFNNYSAAVVDWCWSNGTVTYFRGHTEVSAQWPMEPKYSDFDYDFRWGHNVQGHFGLPWENLVRSTFHRCVWVDGWGNWGVCRAWYE